MNKNLSWDDRVQLSNLRLLWAKFLVDNALIATSEDGLLILSQVSDSDQDSILQETFWLVPEPETY